MRPRPSAARTPAPIDHPGDRGVPRLHLQPLGLVTPGSEREHERGCGEGAEGEVHRVPGRGGRRPPRRTSNGTRAAVSA